MEEVVKRKYPKRKTSKRNKTGVLRPETSERLHKSWADPEWRAKTIASFTKAIAEGRAKNPERAFRFGVPDGMRRERAMKLWDKARKKANWVMAELEKEGVINFDPDVPEEQMARTALMKAFEYVMSPMANVQVRHAHIRTILEWTKAKPATKTDLRLNNAEAWLQEVVTDHQATNGSVASDTDPVPH